jgi:hypothetical protein
VVWDVAERARPVALAGERLLPVLPVLRPLVPEGGLRRGSVVAVSGSTSLALALVAAASATGSWCAAVGVGRPPVGPVAAAELGIVLERFPLVSAPVTSGPGTSAAGRRGWPDVVATLLDALDAVVAWPPRQLRAADARRLVARGRQRGTALVVVGGWPEAVDLRLRVVASGWEGIGEGHGRLVARRIDVESSGRGAAARPRRAALWFPGPPSGES